MRLTGRKNPRTKSQIWSDVFSFYVVSSSSSSSSSPLSLSLSLSLSNKYFYPCQSQPLYFSLFHTVALVASVHLAYMCCYICHFLILLRVIM